MGQNKTAAKGNMVLFGNKLKDGKQTLFIILPLGFVTKKQNQNDETLKVKTRAMQQKDEIS